VDITRRNAAQGVSLGDERLPWGSWSIPCERPSAPSVAHTHVSAFRVFSLLGRSSRELSATWSMPWTRPSTKVIADHVLERIRESNRGRDSAPRGSGPAETILEGLGAVLAKPLGVTLSCSCGAFGGYVAWLLVFSVLRLGPAASGRAGPDEEDDDADDDDERAAYERAKPPSGVPSSLRVCLAAFGCAEPPSGAQSRLRVCRAPFGCAELPCASLCCISILMSGN
jgi:hypothetical protein